MDSLNASLPRARHFLLALLAFCLASSALAQTEKPSPADNPETKKLSSDLIAAKTDDERSAILSSQRNLISRELFDELLRRGESLSNRAEFTDAVTSFSIARLVAEQLHDERLMGVALSAIGTAYSRQGRPAKAIEFRQQALAIFERLGDKKKTADLLSDIGISYRRQDKYELALEYYRKSVSLADELGDLEGKAGTLTNMGVAYDALGDYPQALEHHLKALQSRDAIQDKSVLASILNNTGAVYRDMGEFLTAIDYYKLALAVMEESNDRVGASIYLRNMGTAYLDMGDYRRGLEYLMKGLALIENTEDKVGIATAYNNIGTAYRWQGNYPLALDYYQRSMKLREALADRSGIATNLSNIGRTYLVIGDYDKALEYFQKALTIREAIKSKDTIAVTLALMGAVFAKSGDFPRAEQYLSRALEIREAIKDRRGVAETLLYLSRALRAQQKLPAALDAAQRAEEIFAEMGNPNELWQTRFLSGQIMASLGQPDRAKVEYENAISSIEQLRERLSGGERERQLFFEDKISPYYAMVRLLLAQNRSREALVFAERARARVLSELLSAGRTDIKGEMTVAEQEREQKLQFELKSLNAQLARESQLQQPDEKRQADLKERLQKTRFEFETFHSSLYAIHPELKRYRGETEPLNEARMLTLLSDRKTALLEYSVLEDRTILFVVTRTAVNGKAPIEIRVFTLPVSASELTARSNRFRQSIASRDPIERDAHDLYDLLLKPARAALIGKTSLVIVPDAALWQLPFQALQSFPNHFLLEDAAISYAPSLTALAEMKKHTRTPDGRVETLSLLAFGNPLIAPSRNGQTANTVGARASGPLPEAEREVSEISRLYGSDKTSVFIGAEAREERVKAAASQFRILHFATHGVLDDSSPMYSRVLFSTPSGESKEDGLLEAWEMMNLDLKADLVVLSACETARGRVGAGEGVIGMSWALFVAGTPTTIASQWKVPSRSTADLMVDFHRNLLGKNNPRGEPMTKARALQQASLKQLREGAFRHPFYWAGFILIGDGSSGLR